MPQYNARVIAGLALLALAFTGAEAVVCSANQYLEMDGAYTSSAPNAPKCTDCPSGMTAPAGVAGGYADSAAPRYAAAVALAVAQGSANTNLLTWCNVPEGSWLSGAATATSPGAITACTTTTTTSAGTTISGALVVQTAASHCVTKSACAADKYLESNGAYTSSAPNALVCTACPAGMTAPAGTTLSSTHATAAAAAIAQGSANTNLITWCNVPEGSWLSGAATATSPGAVSSCGDVYQTTTSPATTITAALVVQTAISRCTLLSRCAAGEYLESDGSYQAAATGLLAVSNKLVCTTCPTGMTSYAGATYGALSGAATAAAATSANTNLFTFCNVPTNYWLSTESTTTTPGAITACGSTYGSSDGTLVTGALGAQTELAKCAVTAVAGVAGAAGTAGAAGAVGAAGAAGPAGPAGAAGRRLLRD